MDPDTLALLEEKIQRAVETVMQLRKERDAAIAAVQSTSSEAKRELDALRTECETLKAEREAVKQRLQKLLGHIDKLNAAV
jgi:FtsZ-binding cell division protein ZapB